MFKRRERSPIETELDFISVEQLVQMLNTNHDFYNDIYDDLIAYRNFLHHTSMGSSVPDDVRVGDQLYKSINNVLKRYGREISLETLLQYIKNTEVQSDDQ